MLRLVVCVLLFPVTAVAGEVVWFGEPEPADRLTVSAEALPSGPELDLTDLATASSRFGQTDRRALDDLEAALEEVRPYEARLDGELVIMRDLARPIEAVTVLRTEGDRDVLFKALAYQGFAVDRYFLQTLADDPEGEPFRVTVDGQVLERPWVDANALDPERSITAYDIAEAPQREPRRLPRAPDLAVASPLRRALCGQTFLKNSACLGKTYKIHTKSLWVVSEKYNVHSKEKYAEYTVNLCGWHRRSIQNT